MGGPQDSMIQEGMRLYDGADYDVLVERVASGGSKVIAFGPNRCERNTLLALKTPRRDILAEPRAADAFTRECLFLAALRPHPNILTARAVVRMADSAGPRQFLVLPYAEGGSLRDLLTTTRRQPLQREGLLDTGLYLAQQIATGLAYLHTPDPGHLRPTPTVHADLKPENILVMGDGRVALSGFGLAHLIPGATPGVAIGTPAYMPPEQWEQASAITPAADVYAFGLILSELLAGRHALFDLDQRHTLKEWRQAQARPEPRLLRSVNDHIPIEIETLYLRCLAVDPAARPAATEALAVLQAGARAVGQPVYEPGEPGEETPAGELARRQRMSVACCAFARYEEALEQSDRALRLARGQGAARSSALAAALMTRGDCLEGLGRKAAKAGDQTAAARREAESLATYHAALAAAPQETAPDGRRMRAMIWRQVGELQRNRGRWQAAEEAYVTALDLKPDMVDTYYDRALTMMGWGVSDMRARRREAAIAHLRAARVHILTALGLQYPPAPTLLDDIGAMLRQLGGL